ncbi:MAG: sulfotransferase [Bacteroidales bacterium]|nr:sulfotransferase [Bacteroidales bacterium]
MTCNNPIIIGGSGSSGSTLLINILNKHPKLNGGPELSLLNKEMFFKTPFSVLRQNSKWLIEKGMCTNGWFLYPKINFNAYGFEKNDIMNFFENSKSQKHFLDLFFNSYLPGENKTVWVEKTPSNCYCFNYFEELYPEARFIHIRRDGRDAIASLIKRGMSSYFATMIWIYNTSLALTNKGKKNYYEIAYEDLVTSPEKAIKDLCSFLNVEFYEKMLNPDENYSSRKIESWSLNPNLGISKGSVGKHKKSLKSFHKFTIRNVSISNSHRRKYKLKHTDFESLQKELGYEFDSLIGEQKVSTKNFLYSIKLAYLFVKDVLLRVYMKLKYDKRVDLYPGQIFGVIRNK